jgi:type VI secretion system secreted protein Hcp
MAYDAFLKIDGITGDSKNPSNKGGIDILSFSWGATNTATPGGSGGGAGKVTLQDFRFVTALGAHSVAMMLAAEDGTTLQTAIFSVEAVVGGRVTPFMKWTLSDALISSYQTGGSGGDQPTESFSLAFQKIDVSYGTSTG